MKIGLAYDLKDSVRIGYDSPEDALEEYDSPETVEGLHRALEAEGHTVINLGGGQEFLQNILQEKVDFVFNIAEGLGSHRSRESQVPSVLEMLAIPYSGSDPQCLAVCLDKPLTKKIVSSAGVPTPRWHVISQPHQVGKIDWTDFHFPAFVKPAQDGSSKGVRFGSIIEHQENLLEIVSTLLQNYQQPVMIEEFIDGEEITVGMIGNSPPQVLGIMRILPTIRDKHFVYSLEVKRDWERLVRYECPAQLDKKVLSRIEELSLRVFDVLGCRDFGRIDFRIAPNGTLYFIEINPLAGLNPRSSDLPIMAGKMGWSYEFLISSIMNAATQRYPQCVSA